MKRILFFLVLFFGGVFLHWSVIVFFAAVFAAFFALSLELILVGLFLDSLIYVSPPAAFTAGLLTILIIEEFLKVIVKKESWSGKAIIVLSGLLFFGAVFFLF